MCLCTLWEKWKIEEERFESLENQVITFERLKLLETVFRSYPEMRIDGVINLNPFKQKNNFMRQFYKKFLIT